MTSTILKKINVQIEEHLYLGVSLALYTDGQWTEYYIGETEPNQPTCPNLVYDLASVSKVVGVGTVLIPLIRQGIFELDRPFQYYYPAFADETVTIRQLVTHTSGICPFIPNRDQLNFADLKTAIEKIRVTTDKSFQYTDLNLILLGFLLEEQFKQPLDVLLQEKAFLPLGLTQTSFGPVSDAVPTIKGVEAGTVHDPKAQVLGVHCGSAGLFSTLKDMKRFLSRYLQEDIGSNLINISPDKSHSRSIVWDLKDDWLSHTGYTGPFIMVNRKAQKAAVFLTNRTYLYDDRPLWIAKRRELTTIIRQSL